MKMDMVMQRKVSNRARSPLGYVSNMTDCNDGDALVSPDADELCDGIDNN